SPKRGRMCNGIAGHSVSGEPLEQGESINRLCRALADATQQRAFYLNEDAFCLRFGLHRTARHAINDRDYLRLFHLGGHLAPLDNLAALSGLTAAEAIRKRSGLSQSDLLQSGVLQPADPPESVSG